MHAKSDIVDDSKATLQSTSFSRVCLTSKSTAKLQLLSVTTDLTSFNIEQCKALPYFRLIYCLC